MEIFFKNYQYTILAVSTLGTWGAVIVAVWLAYKSTSQQMEVLADLSKFVPSEAQRTGNVDLDKCETTVSVSMSNKGNVCIYVTYWAFQWRLLFLPIRMQHNPYFPNFRAEPIKLEPGQGTSIFLANDLPKLKESFENLCKMNRVPKFMKKFISLRVFSSNGKEFKAKFGKNFRKDFFKN